MTVVGVDGCRGGWIVVTTPIDTGESTVARVTTLDSLVARVRAGEVIAAAVDMPMGLPSATRRASDAALRAHLGPRRSTVFPTPPRSVLDAVDYPDALRRARAATGVGISKQAWNLVDKIRALDALITPELQPRISEAHPESSFTEMAGAPLTSRKNTADGRQQRIALLSAHFVDVDSHVTANASLAVDVLDAFAVAWTARRIALGTARWFGDDELDDRGLSMRVAV